MSVLFEPQPLAQLRDRFVAALQVLWIADGDPAADAPMDHRRFVFDYEERPGDGNGRLPFLPEGSMRIRAVVARVDDVRLGIPPGEFVQVRFYFLSGGWEQWEQELIGMRMLSLISGIEQLPEPNYHERLGNCEFGVAFWPVPPAMAQMIAAASKDDR